MAEQSKASTPLRAAQALFILNAAIWLLLGVYALRGMAARYPGQASTAWIGGILIFGNAMAMLLSAAGIGKPQSGSIPSPWRFSPSTLC
jgi:hypothetical protein